jgi:hypothetical protein
MNKVKTLSELSHGSLGPIKKDHEGNIYTQEHYASRYWFETKQKAKEFILNLIRSDYAYKMGEIYLESLDPVVIRGEWTVLVNFDLVQTRMNNIEYGR